MDIRLHLSNHERAEYACLSYCWGAMSQPLELTGDLLASFQVSIQLQRLPQSIQDAVIVVRDLGLHYLWVDSLCIIQDSAEDKLKEIKRMDEIYRNSTLTISAASAPNANSGFLNRHRQQPRLSLPFRDSAGAIGTIFLAVCGDDTVFRPQDPLHLRSWPLQEHVAAPRVLVFGTEQMFWICNDYERSAAGNYDQVLKDGGETTDPQIVRMNPLRNFLRHMPKTSSVERDRIWMELVHEYSSRAQSNPEDKIHALRGIAARFQTISKDEYIAGFWKGSILQSLVWSREGEASERPMRHYPTWSWLSIDSPVRLDDYVGKYRLRREPLDARFVELQTGMSNQPFDPFDIFPEAILHIQGYLLHVENPDWANMRLFHTDPPRNQLQWLWPRVASMTLDTKEDGNIAAESLRTGMVSSVWCLPLVQVVVDDLKPHDVNSSARRGGMAVQGLLLVRDSSTVYFKRIGRFCSNVGDGARFQAGKKHEIFIR